MPANNNLCRLGDITFTISDGITGFDTDSGYDYATIDLATGKPTLQAMGETLSEVSIDIKLRNYAGHDVTGQIEALENMRATGEPQMLVFASGIYQGKYVIRGIWSRIRKTDRTGVVTQADIALRLLEFAERKVISTRKTEAKSSPSKSGRKVSAETY